VASLALAPGRIAFMGGRRLREDFVSVESVTDGVRLLSEQPDGDTAMVVIPRDQAVDVSRQILRRIWESSSRNRRIVLLALLIVVILSLLVGAYQVSEALPIGK
jgi:hypothetical protein